MYFFVRFFLRVSIQMGGSTSKLDLPAAPTQEEIFSHSTVSADYAKSIADKAAAAQAAAVATVDEIANATYWFRVKIGTGLFLTIVLAIVTIWYFVGPGKGGGGGGGGGTTTLSVTKATYAGNDVLTKVTSLITSGTTLAIPVPLSSSLGVSGCTGGACTNVFVINYTFSGDATKYPMSFSETQAVNITPSTRTGGGTGTPTDKALPPVESPSLFGRLGSYFTGSGDSGDHLPNAKVATASATIPAASAPISAKNGGAYGYQWWMYIDNWDHNYGKEKSVLVRADPSNTNIVNPSVTLHPTENNLDVAVSVYEGGNSSTGDTFTCSVRDVPLQAWFAVSVTLFDRNLDVYLNGKLVKSCVLPGVPKTVSGDIQLNQGNGFAGYMSNLYTYSRMLVPADAQAFYAAGTPSSALKNTSPTLASALTGNYSLKFGVDSASGKVVDSYTF